MPMLERSLLTVHSHSVAIRGTSAMVSKMERPGHSCRTVRLKRSTQAFCWGLPGRMQVSAMPCVDAQVPSEELTGSRRLSSLTEPPAPSTAVGLENDDVLRPRSLMFGTFQHTQSWRIGSSRSLKGMARSPALIPHRSPGNPHAAPWGSVHHARHPSEGLSPRARGNLLGLVP